MRIVIAPDSFKECLDAGAVAEAIAAGWRRVDADADIDRAPMADGGEGTVDALVAATEGRFVETWLRDPLANRIRARYGILGDGKTAVVEMAAASGLALVPPAQRDPGFTTSYGVGQLLCHAMEQGVSRVIVGLGGSATNDAGAGMAQALGYSLRDADDRELPFGGLALAQLDWIDTMKKHPGLDRVDVVAACDVDNPLCGPHGTSNIYGPQKGGSPKTCELLDAALRHFGDYVEEEFGVSVLERPGAGAAGGLGAGLIVFCDAEIRPGFDVVAEACGLAERIAAADLVITGEGSLDAQSVRGKVPVCVARLAKEAGTPCHAIAGTVDAGMLKDPSSTGFDAIRSLSELAGSREASIADAPHWLSVAAEHCARRFTA